MESETEGKGDGRSSWQKPWNKRSAPFTGIGLIFVGLGCAPIYPSLLHETPDNFGEDKSQAIMGLQMACAYVGSTFMPPVFGLIAEKTNIQLYSIFLMIFIILMFVMVEKLNSIRLKRKE